ncbi:MAG: MucB/RseB C-terminal domain-containing protein, partial [Pseudomonadales bacterium]
MRTSIGLLLCVFSPAVLFGGAALSAEPAESIEPRAWLMDMSEAFNQQSYDGVFGYFSGSQYTTMRIVHMVIDGKQRERLIHLDGAPREIVRSGEEVVCILLPVDELLELDMPAGPFARAFVRRYDNISEYYSLTFYGEGRVADRSTVRLAVTPLDEDRYGYRLWLDKATRLLLKSELIDSDGLPLEVFQFSTIVIGDAVKVSSLEPTNSHAAQILYPLSLDTEPSIPAYGPSRWSAQWLPVGYTMAGSTVRTTVSMRKSIDTMMYSDGLAAFSVFIEDMPPAGAASMVSRNGATVAVTHLTRGPEDGPHLVTLVGELPTSTAQ